MVPLDSMGGGANGGNAIGIMSFSVTGGAFVDMCVTVVVFWLLLVGGGCYWWYNLVIVFVFLCYWYDLCGVVCVF